MNSTPADKAKTKGEKNNIKVIMIKLSLEPRSGT